MQFFLALPNLYRPGSFLNQGHAFQQMLRMQNFLCENIHWKVQTWGKFVC